MRNYALVAVGLALAGWLMLWPPTTSNAYAPPVPVFDGPSTRLRQSVIVPTLDTPFDPQRNAIWCATLELAWQHLERDVLKGPVTLEEPPEEVERLNRAASSQLEVPQEDCLAMAGVQHDHVEERIRDAMSKRFGRAYEMRRGLPPDAVIAYAYLQTAIRFPVPYFENHDKFMFRGADGRTTPVSSFGIRAKDGNKYYNLRNQVEVLYALIAHDLKHFGASVEFVIDPYKQSSPNQLVLACVKPARSLLETVLHVQGCIRDWKPDADYERGFSSDTLLIPNMHWHITHDYAELEGKRLTNQAFKTMTVSSIRQETSFQLDRSGAELKSEANVNIGTAMARNFEYNRPFLLYITKRGANLPFFAMWVGNAELLCKPSWLPLVGGR